MSRLSDSSVILTSQFRVRSIILMLLVIQMSNMSNLSLCQLRVDKQQQLEGMCMELEAANWHTDRLDIFAI